MEAKDSPVFMHTTVFLIQQSWMIIASLLSDCAHTYKFFENGVANEAIVLQWLVQTTSSDFKIVKKQWAGALLSVKCCCFVHNPSWKSHLWTSLSEEDKEEEEEGSQRSVSAIPKPTELKNTHACLVQASNLSQLIEGTLTSWLIAFWLQLFICHWPN